ncbi:MAG: hypothetical protein JO287_22490 [Pseudonocardiales bacterium]|nr:hypothetical protein [Pseudonocardiales bacterium]
MTELRVSTSLRCTWLWAPDADTAARVREITGGRTAYRNGNPLPVVTDVDIGVIALEACQALAAAGHTFTWHESEHPLNRDNWPSQLLAMPQPPARLG